MFSVFYLYLWVGLGLLTNTTPRWHYLYLNKWRPLEQIVMIDDTAGHRMVDLLTVE